MKRARTLIWVAVLWLMAPGASADGLLDSYTDFFDNIVERVQKLDIYGTTSQLPQGIFSFRYKWNHRRAAGRFTSQRVTTNMMEPITFDANGQEIFNLDLGASGEGAGITFQFSYGITDPLDWYIEIPFQYMDIQMRPKLKKMVPWAAVLLGADPEWFDEETFETKPRYINEAAEAVLNFIPQLGRPPLMDPGPYPLDVGPGKSYHSNGWVMADIHTGFSWNFYRSYRWSGALTGRVLFPTGNVADPNNSLTLGTGPEIDVGTGSFGVGITQNYDLRLFKYSYWINVVLSGEFNVGYMFKSKRRYPDFTKPSQQAQTLMAAVPEMEMYFPDLSHLAGKTYEYIPGVSCDAMVMLGISSLIFDFGIGIGYSYNQEPEIYGDWAFNNVVRNLEMQAQGHYEIMRVAVGVSLLPFYIPLGISYQYEKNIGGRNTLIFDQNHHIQVQGYLPTSW